MVHHYHKGYLLDFVRTFLHYNSLNWIAVLLYSAQRGSLQHKNKMMMLFF